MGGGCGDGPASMAGGGSGGIRENTGTWGMDTWGQRSSRGVGGAMGVAWLHKGGDRGRGDGGRHGGGPALGDHRVGDLDKEWGGGSPAAPPKAS